MVFSWSYTLLRDTGGILLDQLLTVIRFAGRNSAGGAERWRFGRDRFACLAGRYRKICRDGFDSVAHEPKSCDSYRALLRGYHELVHVMIETHHCPEDHASVASS